MGYSDFRDLCIVQTLHFQALLRTAYAGPAGSTNTDSVEEYRSALALWESIAAATSEDALTTEQREAVRKARQSRNT